MIFKDKVSTSHAEVHHSFPFEDLKPNDLQGSILTDKAIHSMM